MPDHDEDLRRLRAADPIEHDALPSAQDLEAQQLFERITMRTPNTLSRRPLLIAAAALAVLAVTGAGIATRNNDATATRSADAPTTTQAPITSGGSLGSCVETYNADTLKRRDVAFDGTVDGVDGETVSFTVNTWFRGGSAARTTREGASTIGGMTSAGTGVSLEPGTRLLVAGDGEFAWSCGFTQPYAPAVAQEWAAAFAS